MAVKTRPDLIKYKHECKFFITLICLFAISGAISLFNKEWKVIEIAKLEEQDFACSIKNTFTNQH